MAPETPGTGSTVRRILLGSQLRRLREAQGVSRQDAGYVIRASESKISRLELGRVSFKERDVEDLLTLYGVSDARERNALLQLARDANTPGWWHRYTDVLPSWFQTYVGLEESAALIRTYELQFVPGLLQSEGYARAIIQQGNAGAPESEIEQRVSLRLQRQERLTAPDAPRLWAVLDESALKRPIGGPEVMRGQLEHLIEVSKLPNVTIQVMPFKFGAHAAEGGAFTILRFPEQDLPDVVYVESLTGAMYLDKRDDVDTYLQAMERLSVDSATPEHTVELLGDFLRET
ncbi:transcriptional regulator with XRE-family HTH domain [Actinomadura rupiterrae]|nr:helix-turn-helix transcriptional regulator [Actinomadura rupiterrae]MCP2337018.1 transcriptional regulator with XRE-family HTH domain [Actinomadura rupiterrae]